MAISGHNLLQILILAVGLHDIWTSSVAALHTQRQELADARWAHHRLPIHVL